MISIIICSRTAAISKELEANIDATIGMVYEIIVIDNSANKYSIFEAYNIGVKKSSYPYLCFMHDDIMFHSNNWGLKVIDYFKDEQTGAIGVAGSPYAPQMPGSWWGGGLVSQQLLVNDGDGLEPFTASASGNTSAKNQVVLLDGIWICIRKSLFGKIKFDEELFKGYHFYDLDISLQIHSCGYKVYSVFDILMEHFSKGNMNQDWAADALIFQQKWRKSLPVSCISLSYKEQCVAEYKTLKELISVLLAKKASAKKTYWLAMQQISRFHKGYFYYKTPAYFIHYLNKYLQINKSERDLQG